MTIETIECVECGADAETVCTYCGIDLCYDCVDDHQGICADLEE